MHKESLADQVKAMERELSDLKMLAGHMIATLRVIFERGLVTTSGGDESGEELKTLLARWERMYGSELRFPVSLQPFPERTKLDEEDQKHVKGVGLEWREDGGWRHWSCSGLRLTDRQARWLSGLLKGERTSQCHEGDDRGR